MQKLIEDYGLIGDCRSCALVSNEASIDFMCLPNFDSPAQFCAILDPKKGGYFQIRPIGFFKTHQRYFDQTNVLETNFFNQVGAVTVTDFMPISKSQEKENSIPKFGTKLVRLIKAQRGNQEILLELKITPNFAEGEVEIEDKGNYILIAEGGAKFVLYKKHHQVAIKKWLISIKFKLKEGEQEFFALDYLAADHPVSDIPAEDLNARLAKYYFETIKFWQWWVSICHYKGAYSDQVIRSALILKMLTFTPTGAIVAAPTTSLPEKLGGSLNWDYRYTWLRDASFTVYAFLGLGYIKEAGRFINWLERVCLNSDELKIMYGIHGEEEIAETELERLSGYQGSKPVRVGNGASTQKQFDIFGEVLTAINLYVNAGGKISEPVKQFIVRLVNYCCAHWREEDAGIWEIRYGRKHNTYSKLMCWAGVDRGIKLAKKLKISGADISAWEKTRQEIKEDILAKGFNKEVNSFTAFYGSKVLDTSTLNIPIVGFLPADDPRVLSTLDQVMRKLVVDWFVLRTSDSGNDLQEGEGAFFLPTFWLIDCLLLLGRVGEATVWLEKIIHDSSPLGLYAEELDPISKKHLGNYPQAFTHLGLINSVLNLKQAEVFGIEKKPTTQSDRLFKVVKSLLQTEIHPALLANRTLTQLFRILSLSRWRKYR